MKMNKMNDKKMVKSQYKDDTLLNIRKKLHQLYSVNQTGFNHWLYKTYEFEDGMRVLEVGSGNGDIWEGHIDFLSKKVDMTLSDFSIGMVDILSKKYANINMDIRQINIESIPFEEEQFDVVIANMMLYHVPDLNNALMEVRRVLKKDGTFYAATFGENGLTEYIVDVLSTLSIMDLPSMDYHFTLQNGERKMSPFFNEIEISIYEDELKVTSISDLIDYISTMQIVGTLSNDDKEKLYTYFEEIMKEEGVIVIPKEYGTFISKK